MLGHWLYGNRSHFPNQLPCTHLLDSASRAVITTSHRIFCARLRPSWNSTQVTLLMFTQSLLLLFVHCIYFMFLCTSYCVVSALAKPKLHTWSSGVCSLYVYTCIFSLEVGFSPQHSCIYETPHIMTQMNIHIILS